MEFGGSSWRTKNPLVRVRYAIEGSELIASFEVITGRRMLALDSMHIKVKPKK